jgi:hypothetical protein
MKIEVISMWYNEEVLAPLFVMHYGFADRITVLLDTDTNDQSAEEAKKACPTELRFVGVNSGDGLDNHYKRARLNKQYQQSLADWIIVVDADEFLFVPPHGEQPVRDFLAQVDGNVVRVDYWAVFKHLTDAPLDRTQPPLFQRRHGIKEGLPGSRQYCKPSIAQRGAISGWDFGIHQVLGNCRPRYATRLLAGAHWRMAEPSFVYARMERQRQRHSKRDRQLGLGHHCYEITDPVAHQIIQEHENDPQLF